MQSVQSSYRSSLLQPAHHMPSQDSTYPAAGGPETGIGGRNRGLFWSVKGVWWTGLTPCKEACACVGDLQADTCIVSLARYALNNFLMTGYLACGAWRLIVSNSDALHLGSKDSIVTGSANDFVMLLLQV